MIAVLPLLYIPWLAAAVSPQIRREQQSDPNSFSQVYMSSEGIASLSKAHSFVRSEADPDSTATDDTAGATDTAADANATSASGSGDTAAADDATTATTDLT